MTIIVREARPEDRPGIWQVLEPTIRAGETWALPRDWTEATALAFWLAPLHSVFVAEEDGRILGTYFLRPNHPGGGGAHIANCGYMVAADAFGRGVGRMLGEDSLARARARGFTAMQFNYVVAANERAVRLWTSIGFTAIGRVPGGFHHPTLGPVDALMMFRTL